MRNIREIWRTSRKPGKDSRNGTNKTNNTDKGPMIDLTIKWEGLNEWVSHLNSLEKKQLPFALAKGITDTAKDVKAALQKEMKRVFDNPTRFTINSIYIVPAKKGIFIAFVGLKGDQNHYLYPQTRGGRRNLKQSEASLQSTGKMTKGLHIMPGAGIRLNKFGNITKGKMTKIMSVIKGHRDKRQNTTARSKRRNKSLPSLFVAKKGNRRTQHLQPGIYQRTKKGIKPILIYAHESKYLVRFRFVDVAQKVTDKNLVRNVLRAMEFAIKTAR